MKPGRLVIVSWWDIVGTGRWDDHEPVDLDPILCHTVGWLACRNDTKVVVTSTYTTEGTGGSTAIPTGCVESVKELNEE